MASAGGVVYCILGDITFAPPFGCGWPCLTGFLAEEPSSLSCPPVGGRKCGPGITSHLGLGCGLCLGGGGFAARLSRQAYLVSAAGLLYCIMSRSRHGSGWLVLTSKLLG